MACTAELVPAGSIEIETGYAFRRASNPPKHAGELLLKFSVLDGLQFQLGTNDVVASSAHAATVWDAAFAGPKLLLTSQGRVMPAVALSAFLAFPTRAGGAALQSTFDLDVWAYVSKDFGRLHVDLNAGVNILDLGAPSLQPVVALSPTIAIGAGFDFSTEWYGFFGGGPRDDAGWLNAITYSPVPELVLDLGGDVGLKRSIRSFTLFAGLTVVPYRFRY